MILAADGELEAELDEEDLEDLFDNEALRGSDGKEQEEDADNRDDVGGNEVE